MFAPLLALLLSPGLIAAVTIQQLPQCVQNCLSNSTFAQVGCGVLNAACLCANTAYVSSLSCCLATQCNTQEQQLAIQFNQQECAAVNQTAPGFVGCSPFGLSSTIILGSGGQAATTGSILGSPGMGTTMLTKTNSQTTVITASAVPEPAVLSGTRTVTATFSGKALMTGSCSMPYFAIVTDSAGMITEFPAVGCAPDREDCCPYDNRLNAELTICPQDYFTIAGGCCPVGYQVYSTNIGPETPCYTMPSMVIVPAVSPTMTGLTLITDHLFAQKFPLTHSNSSDSKSPLGKLPVGGLIGIILNVILFIALIIAIIWYRKRKIRKLAEAQRAATTYPPVDPTLPVSEFQEAQELPSPESQGRTPRSSTANWPIYPVSSPPSYEQKSRPASAKASVPQELPGSTFIHEHHPAYFGLEISPTRQPWAPVTPTKSPPGSETGSPLVTPASSALGGRSPPRVVSPLASPKLPSRPS